jgi:hypothetical protein
MTKLPLMLKPLHPNKRKSTHGLSRGWRLSGRASGGGVQRWRQQKLAARGPWCSVRGVRRSGCGGSGRRMGLRRAGLRLAGLWRGAAPGARATVLGARCAGGSRTRVVCSSRGGGGHISASPGTCLAWRRRVVSILFPSCCVQNGGPKFLT